MTQNSPWRKSSRSGSAQSDNCVEVRLSGESPQVSDSKLADDRPILTISAASYKGLLAWLKDAPEQ